MGRPANQSAHEQRWDDWLKVGHRFILLTVAQKNPSELFNTQSSSSSSSSSVARCPTRATNGPLICLYSSQSSSCNGGWGVGGQTQWSLNAVITQIQFKLSFNCIFLVIIVTSASDMLTHANSKKYILVGVSLYDLCMMKIKRFNFLLPVEILSKNENEKSSK